MKRHYALASAAPVDIVRVMRICVNELNVVCQEAPKEERKSIVIDASDSEGDESFIRL